MRFAFFGDGSWATDSLNRLILNGHIPLFVVLRQHTSEATLKEFAQSKNIPIYAPKKVNAPSFVDWVTAQSPDLNISVSYDQIFGPSIIKTAKKGFINAHAGKLPDYRGRNVINWAIINNESELGLTVHYIDDGIDTGPIISQQILPIHWDDDYGTVLSRVQRALPDLLVETVHLIEKNQAPAKRQDHLIGTYFTGRTHGDEWIDWSDKSLNIYNKIRGIAHPGPGARTTLSERILIIWEAEYQTSWPCYQATPGTVVGIKPGKGIQVKTGDSTIVLKSVQVDGNDKTDRLPTYKIGTRFGRNMSEELKKLQNEICEMRIAINRTLKTDDIDLHSEL